MPRFLLLLLVLVAVPAMADERTPGPQTGGRFRAADAESLGYDQFRRLEAGAQLQRRDDARAWLRRAREYANQGASAADPAERAARVRDAVDACATAVGLVPYLPDAWLEYAKHLNALGLYADASVCLQHFDDTLRYERREDRREQLQGEAHAVGARVAFNLGQSERSEREARAALEIEENDDETRLVLVRALIDLGRFDEAREAVAAFADQGPIYPHALAVLAVLEMRDGDLRRAEEVFDRAWEYGMRGAVFENDRGRLYLELGEYDEAVRCFQRALETVPTFHEARNNLAVAHRRAGRLVEADTVLQQLLEEYSDYGPAHFNRAEVLRARLEAATSDSVRNWLGAEAFLHYTAAIEAGYEPQRVMSRRAELAYQTEDLEQAEADLLRMTEDPSVDGRVLFLLGRVKKQQGRLDIAQSLLEMAAERGYDTPRLYAELGEVLARRGDLEGARDALSRAIESDAGEFVVTRVNLSAVLAQLGETERAHEVLEEAERLAPEHPLVRQQREALGPREP